MDYKNVSPALAELAKSYQYKEPPSAFVWLQEMISNLLRLLKDFLTMLRFPNLQSSDSRAAGDVLQFLLISFGILCGLVVLYIAARRLSHIDSARKLALSGALSSDLPLDQQGWKQYAARLLQEQNYRESVRAVYMSALYLLDEKGIMTFAQNKTNYEYFYALGTKSALKYNLQAPFRQLVDRVESVWFGFAPCDQADYDFCLNQLAVMESALAGAQSAKVAVQP